MNQGMIFYAIFYTLSIRLLFVTTFEHNNGYKPDGENLRVLVNDTAQIKCDVGSNLADDKVLLVVWYKNNLPIYSYDTRGAHAGTPSHWRDDEVLEDRAIFRTHKEPAELIITPVKEKDSGNFRCRVDFKRSQTRNSNINLEVVVPPQKPNIFDEHRMRIDLQAGPYEEGGNLELTCVVYGGSPPPTVNWLLNGQTLNSVFDNSFEGTINSKLVVRNLSRNHQHATYTCQASNFHEKYVSANVTIELYLRPMLVEITVTNQPMSADRKYEIECRAFGSRPPAKISWWISNIELENYTQNVSNDGNISTSILKIKPTRDDHGRPLYCRAINTFVRNGLQETSMKLNVFFTPSLQLDLGSNLNPEDIEEGDDVYFECKVHANPAAYKVVWKHNNQIIQHNQRAGVIVSSGDLALQGVTQHLAGNYTCTASNVEGDGDSNVVQLKVMYKPICRADQKTVYGVARNEEAEISCEVDAFPAPESFKWSFNNTAETFDMPQSGFQRHSAQGSTLKYTPMKEMDFGTIMCWADNNVGQQKEPCVFHLIAAGKPAMPHNCSVVNQTTESLEINCIEGFDGGLRQWFLMEIYEKHSGTLQANISSKYPIFGASGLDAGHVFKVFIFAVNARGKSDAVQIETFTKIGSEKQKTALISYKGSQANISFTPLLSAALLLAVCSALICLSIGTVMAFKLRTYKQRQKYHHQQSEILARPASLQVKEKLSPALVQSEELFDDKNPDVVPDKKDADIKQILTIQTPPTVLLGNNQINLSNKQLTNKYNTYYDHEKEEDSNFSDTLVRSKNTKEEGDLKSRNCQVSENKNMFNNSITINVCRSNISETSYTSSSHNKCQHSFGDDDSNMFHHPQTAYHSPPNPNCRTEFSNFCQLDQLKNISGKGTGGIQPNVVTPVLQEVSTCLSPTVAQICAIFPPSSALNGLQPPDQINNSFRMMVNEDIKFQYGSLNMTPTYKKDILGPILIGNNAVNFTSISPSNSLSGLSSAKTFSREIVTVRTPLMYSQQESCV